MNRGKSERQTKKQTFNYREQTDGDQKGGRGRGNRRRTLTVHLP